MSSRTLAECVDIAADAVQRAAHLTARDEWRYNFSLNSLRGPDGSLPGHFNEWALPGAHSDIGGGYPDNFHEHIQVALRQMYRLAKDTGVPLSAVKPTDTGLSLPDELQPIATRITHHINEGQPLRLSAAEEALLRQRYIHHSAHYQIAGPLFPFKPAPGGVRGIHPNRGLK